MSEKGGPSPENPPFAEEKKILPGELLTLCLKTSRRALLSGALKPLSVTTELHPSGRARIHLLHYRPRKNFEPEPKPKKNPFLPYEPDLFVGDISESHLVVLNKFPIVEGHLLIITRNFREQR